MSHPPGSAERLHDLWAQRDAATPFAYVDGRLVTWGQLWSAVRWLGERLPDRRYVFNLCQDRLRFCVLLLASLWRGQISLLPPSGSHRVLEELLREYPDAYLAAEQAGDDRLAPWFSVPPGLPHAPSPPVSLPEADPAAILFTSGSSGRYKTCPHTLATFAASARQAVSSLGLASAERMLICTAPPQHMFGLETSIFWPLFSTLVVAAGRPFFPETIRNTLRAAPLPGLLVSTPTHLRAMAEAGEAWPNLAGILSATDWLPDALASRLETLTGAPVQEILGSTETLSFASRRTVDGPLWRPYREARVNVDLAGAAWLASPHLATPVALDDRLRVEADGRFEWLGRTGDLVKIAGKRGSLTELNQRLNGIDGVDEGLYYVYETATGEARMAVVVVTRLTRQELLAALRPCVDAVFLPRRVKHVERLPRDALGKIPRVELEKVLAAL